MAAKENSRYRVVSDLILTARVNGGTKMDCHGKTLVNMYERSGYIPVARVPFNPDYVDSPLLLEQKYDVYVMMKNDKSIDEILEDFKNATYLKSEQEYLNSLPMFVDYDEALAYRDKLLKG